VKFSEKQAKKKEGDSEINYTETLKVVQQILISKNI
jgi:hypothetical protein